MRSSLIAFVVLLIAPNLAMSQEVEKPQARQKGSIWNSMLPAELNLAEPKVDSSQVLSQAFKLAQVLAIPLIEATKSISANFAAASEHFDPFGMKEAQQTLRWQQEVIIRQQETLLRWQQQEIERLQVELKDASRSGKEKKRKAKKSQTESDIR
jgi:hypothetical protein